MCNINRTIPDAPVDMRFGRCQYFVIVDSETMEYDAMQNPSIGASGGAGIQVAQTVAGKGVSGVITGNLGPTAVQTLAAAGITMVTCASGTVRDAAQQYKSGGMQQTTSPAVPDHSGLSGAGVGAGAGMGGGGGGRQRIGPVQSCRCPNCGYTQPHQLGVPCLKQACPKFGAAMVWV